ncbi:hypothetical protein OIE50_33650 [Streptomyces canus]|uniref:hypothetical protein n=1 Tax=Streptomyces canus TaxID=58343 RepID=UPI00324F80DA
MRQNLNVDTTFMAALLAAVVTAGGWLANHWLSGRAERTRRLYETSLAHVDKQLEELYGPLVFLVQEGRTAWRDFCDTLGREVVFEGPGALTEEEIDLWLFWVDNEFIPRNSAIQILLSSKAHLVVGNSMPDSHLAFIEHHASWRVAHLRWKDKGVAYRWHAKVNWPKQFETEVIETYKELKNRQAELAGHVLRI